MSEYDARDFQTSSFIKKDTLKRDGPQRLTIKAVEKADGIARDGKPPKPVLQLTFTNDSKFGLGTQINLRRVIEAFGEKTSRWIGQSIELYYSPDVRGPSGEEGGIRVRPPTGPVPTVTSTDFTAALTSAPAVSAATQKFVEGLEEPRRVS
jgi:hypothetical protein